MINEPPDYRERLKLEYKELVERCFKLKLFLTRSDTNYQAVSPYQRHLMLLQLDCMKKYLVILTCRLLDEEIIVSFREVVEALKDGIVYNGDDKSWTCFLYYGEHILGVGSSTLDDEDTRSAKAYDNAVISASSYFSKNPEALLRIIRDNNYMLPKLGL